MPRRYANPWASDRRFRAWLRAEDPILDQLSTDAQLQTAWQASLAALAPHRRGHESAAAYAMRLLTLTPVPAYRLDAFLAWLAWAERHVDPTGCPWDGHSWHDRLRWAWLAAEEWARDPGRFTARVQP